MNMAATSGNVEMLEFLWKSGVPVRNGIDYTLEKLGPTTFFPMHAGTNPARYAEVWNAIGPRHTRVEVVIPRDNGDSYDYSPDKEHAMN